MDVDPDRFAAQLAARLAAIVPDGFRVTLEDDMLWFRSDPGRFPGQQNNYDAAQRALDVLQDYIAEATHDPWPGQRTMPEPHAQIRDSALHLWYGPADDVVLACEPLPLADLGS